MKIIDSCSFLAPEAAKVVHDWAARNIPDGEYETCAYMLSGKLVLARPGDAIALGHAVPTKKLHLVLERSGTSMVFRHRPTPAALSIGEALSQLNGIPLGT